MNKTEIARNYLGMNGSIISESKTEYRREFPHNLSIFNSNICNEKEKIWFGDIDLTKRKSSIEALSEELNEDLYVLYELDGRFENEKTPRVEKYVAKFFYDGGAELSTALIDRYDSEFLLKTVDQ